MDLLVYNTKTDLVGFSLSTGQLECRDHTLLANQNGNTWCDHIRDFVKENLDAPLMWNNWLLKKDETRTLYRDTDFGYPSGYISNSFVIPVPIFPTLNIWSNVALFRYSNNPLVFKVFLWTGDSKSEKIAFCLKTSNADFPVFDEFSFEQNSTIANIGFLNSSEGVAVLRSLAFSWFKSYWNHWSKLGIKTCINKKHQFTAEKLYKKDMKEGGNKALRQAWCLWKYKECAFCFKLNQSQSDWSPDLVDYS